MDLADKILAYSLIGMLISIFFYYMLIFINLVLTYSLHNKYHIVFHKKKDKIYDGKTSPIYNIDDPTLANYYCVQKWELQWEEYKKYKWLTRILIYPIKIMSWQYVQVGDIPIGDKKEVEGFYNTLKKREMTIGMWFEEQLELKNISSSLESKIKVLFVEQLDELNGEFNKNYIE